MFHLLTTVCCLFFKINHLLSLENTRYALPERICFNVLYQVVLNIALMSSAAAQYTGTYTHCISLYSTWLSSVFHVSHRHSFKIQILRCIQIPSLFYFFIKSPMYNALKIFQEIPYNSGHTFLKLSLVKTFIL